MAREQYIQNITCIASPSQAPVLPTPYCVILIRTVPKLMIAAGTKSWSG